MIRPLGRGGFGTAHLVHPVGEPERLLVAKEIALPPGDAAAAAAARHEASLLAACSHPNIVRHVGTVVTHAALWVVMDYADGGDVAGRIASLRASGGHYAEGDVLSVLAQAALALCHLHAMHVLHRDVKPGNIFLTAGGMVKLGDFGVARRMAASAEMARTQIGSPYYLSPELARGRPYGRKSDMWALGVT